MARRKLKIISKSYHLIGSVIEVVYNGKYQLREYGPNEYGVYDVLNVTELEGPAVTELFSQDTFMDRMRVFRKYFPNAKYISAEVVNILNFDNEVIGPTINV